MLKLAVVLLILVPSCRFSLEERVVEDVYEVSHVDRTVVRGTSRAVAAQGQVNAEDVLTWLGGAGGVGLIGAGGWWGRRVLGRRRAASGSSPQQ